MTYNFTLEILIHRNARVCVERILFALHFSGVFRSMQTPILVLTSDNRTHSLETYGSI